MNDNIKLKGLLDNSTLAKAKIYQQYLNKISNNFILTSVEVKNMLQIERDIIISIGYCQKKLDDDTKCKIESLLNSGPLAKAKLYQSYIDKISRGVKLSPIELKSMAILEDELSDIINNKKKMKRFGK